MEKPSEGDLVEVQDCNKNFLAIGHYQVGSIAVRVVTFEKERIDDYFWKNKISQAYKVRCELGLVNPPQNNTYRLVHGEGDNLPRTHYRCLSSYRCDSGTFRRDAPDTSNRC